MSCHHKFQQYLDLSTLDFEPDTLIVGTFYPQWPASNTAGWFYGNTARNHFWDILPRIYGSGSLEQAGPAEWKEFCRNHKIALTDLIGTIEDAEPVNKLHNEVLAGGADKAIAYHFDDFDFVNVVQLLQRHPSIRNVYLTRGATEAFWRHLWNPVVRYCHTHGLHERKLLVPTADSAYHHSAHNTEHSANPIPLLQDYLLMRWRAEWHFQAP